MTYPTFLGENVKASMHAALSRDLPLWNGETARGWLINGHLVFGYNWAPDGLVTRRQLRELCRAPGAPAYAVMVWRHGKGVRWAWLYRLDLTRWSVPASPAKLAALDKAMTERRRCRTCRTVQAYCVPTSDGRCDLCMAAAKAGPWRWAA